jgi:serine/threonine protein kinase
MNEKVGEGTYGCVFKPSLKCKEKISSYENKVSKVMINREATNELKEYKSISTIKGLEKYAITQPILCKPVIDDNFISSVGQCRNPLIKNVYKNKSHHSMLIYEDGGINITNFVVNIFKKVQVNDQHYFLTSLITLIDGLLFFKAKNILHRDIKADNIVYNINNGKIKYIDFGLMIKKTRAITLSKQSKDVFAIDHSYWPPENICRNYYIYKDFSKCNYLKDNKKYNYPDFLELAIDSFDLYTLALVFYQIGSFLFNIDKYKKFGKDMKQMSKYYALPNLFERKTNITTFKEEYTALLKKHKIYLTSGTPSASIKIQDKVESIYKEELKKEIKKKECPPEKPIHNPNTNRCLMECKDGYIRNEEYKCVVNKSLIKKKSNKTKKSSSSKMSKKSACVKKNMDYNPKTTRCNKKCKAGETRNDKFKCVKIS